MKIISTKAHGYIDYLMGALLIALPWLLNFNRGGAETWVPVCLGISTILYSLMTNYEVGLIRVFSMKTHLVLDGISGVLLATSPWLFNFNDYVSTPHVVLGIMELLAVMMTQSVVGERTGLRTRGGRRVAHGNS